MLQLNATTEEILTVVREMFPAEYDRAVAELTIRKLSEENRRLTAELASRDASREEEQAA
jgi:hypothetical protein